jgi:hypothetical protein
MKRERLRTSEVAGKTLLQSYAGEGVAMILKAHLRMLPTLIINGGFATETVQNSCCLHLNLP